LHPLPANKGIVFEESHDRHEENTGKERETSCETPRQDQRNPYECNEYAGGEITEMQNRSPPSRSGN
jgi:hypothetical protein